MASLWLRLALVAVFLYAVMPTAWGWSAHRQITNAALAVLPEAERWKMALGEKNYNNLGAYSLMPDAPRGDSGDFYHDDYLLMRGLPDYVNHTLPEVRQTFAPCFSRALTALRTETPLNACRQLGSVIHYVEDIGAPPHAAAPMPKHNELETWFPVEKVDITGYTPRLLGETDAEALEGLQRRVNELIAFSAPRALRALPLVLNGERSRVEPIILESALESARAAADVLYTVFTLGLNEQPIGASLEGVITTPALTPNNAKGARIVLLDAARFDGSTGDPEAIAHSATDFCTLAISTGQFPVEIGWQGTYAFHHLPPGMYRVLAYRPGARWKLSDPVALGTGVVSHVDLSLDAAVTAGNLLPNPDATLRALQPGKPDYWSYTSSIWGPIRFSTMVWVSTMPVLASRTAYRCGAILKDPTAIVRFHFTGHEPFTLPTGQPLPPETQFTTSDGKTKVYVTVETAKPLWEAVEQIWVMPERVPVSTD